MTGAFGELGSLLKQAQQMQRDVERARKELGERSVEGRSPDGSVTVVLSGDRRVTKIEIASDAHARLGKAELENALMAALREGNDKATQLSHEILGKVTGGLNLPGLF